MKGCLRFFAWGIGVIALLIVGVGVIAGLSGEVSTTASTSTNATAGIADAKSDSFFAPDPTITFTSDPPGAGVYIDGETFATYTTPAKIQLAPGPHNYRVGFEDYQEEFGLYKPFKGKLNVTKDDGVSVWLDRFTAEEIAARKAREAEAAAAVQAAQEAEVDAQRAYYRVETDCPSGVNVTYFNSDGNITQMSNRSSEWFYAFVPNSGDYLSISAQNQCDYGAVTVKIVQAGLTLEENTSEGAYTIASVDGRWP